MRIVLTPAGERVTGGERCVVAGTRCVVVRGELTGVTSSAGLVIADQLTTFIVACTVRAWAAVG